MANQPDLDLMRAADTRLAGFDSVMGFNVVHASSDEVILEYDIDFTKPHKRPPRLPKGIFIRKNRKSCYCRVYKDGKDRYVALGTDLRDAVKKMHALRSGLEQVPAEVKRAEEAKRTDPECMKMEAAARGHTERTARLSALARGEEGHLGLDRGPHPLGRAYLVLRGPKTQA